MSKPLSKRVGELFAHIQDLFDTAAHSAIQRVDEKGGKKNRLLGFFLQPVMLILANTMKSKNGKNPTWILK